MDGETAAGPPGNPARGRRMEDEGRNWQQLIGIALGLAVLALAGGYLGWLHPLGDSRSVGRGVAAAAVRQCQFGGHPTVLATTDAIGHPRHDSMARALAGGAQVHTAEVLVIGARPRLARKARRNHQFTRFTHPATVLARTGAAPARVRIGSPTNSSSAGRTHQWPALP